MFGGQPREYQREDMDVGATCSTRGRKFRVGCALLPKKVSRYLTKRMQRIASSRGLELVLLDHTRPLIDQGDYDAIVHKLRPNKEWEKNLQEYISAKPGVKVIDSLAGIRIVHNRTTMLLPLREDPDGIALQGPYARNGKGGHSIARVQSPTQVEITEGMSLAEAQAGLRQAGLVPPLLVKPLWTDGREGSHGLAVLHDMAALNKVLQGCVCAALKPPLVVQQFVDHGGVLFKVYVIGSRTVVCLRPSLGDSHLSEEAARRAGVQPLPRISCKSSYPKGSPEDRLSAGVVYDTTTAIRTDPKGSSEDWRLSAGAVHDTTTADTTSELTSTSIQSAMEGGDMAAWSAPGRDEALRDLSPQHQHHRAAPPDWVTSALARTLSDKLGLQLFNFDMICPEDQPSLHEQLYYVVDINYFPGVDKIPGFEHMFVDFLTATCEGAESNIGQSGGEGDKHHQEHRYPHPELHPSLFPVPGSQNCVGLASSDGDGVSSGALCKAEDLVRLLCADAPSPAAVDASCTWGGMHKMQLPGVP